jgi:hypothetical protein
MKPGALALYWLSAGVLEVPCGSLATSHNMAVGFFKTSRSLFEAE